MAYFPNGTCGLAAQEDLCFRCRNWAVRDDPCGEEWCPVWDLHTLWNYDAIGCNIDQIKKQALESLWPRTANGLENEKCRLFIPRPGQEDPNQLSFLDYRKLPKRVPEPKEYRKESG